MKFTIIFSIFFSLMISAHADTRNFVCSFAKGETYSKTTGMRVARTFSPKVIQGSQRLDVEADQKEIFLRSIASNTIHMHGFADCEANDLIPGFDCYEVVQNYPVRETFRAHIGNKGQKQMKLAMDLSIPGGALQFDEYRCTR